MPINPGNCTPTKLNRPVNSFIHPFFSSRFYSSRSTRNTWVPPTLATHMSTLLFFIFLYFTSTTNMSAMLMYLTAFYLNNSTCSPTFRSDKVLLSCTNIHIELPTNDCIIRGKVWNDREIHTIALHVLYGRWGKKIRASTAMAILTPSNYC